MDHSNFFGEVFVKSFGSQAYLTAFTAAHGGRVITVRYECVFQQVTSISLFMNSPLRNKEHVGLCRINILPTHGILWHIYQRLCPMKCPMKYIHVLLFCFYWNNSSRFVNSCVVFTRIIQACFTHWQLGNRMVATVPLKDIMVKLASNKQQQNKI